MLRQNGIISYKNHTYFTLDQIERSPDITKAKLLKFLSRRSLSRCRHGFSLQVSSAMKWSSQTSANAFILPHEPSVQTATCCPRTANGSSVQRLLQSDRLGMNTTCVLWQSQETGANTFRSTDGLNSLSPGVSPQWRF